MRACRAMYAGALLAAQDGLPSVPEPWREKTASLTALEIQVDQLVAQRVIIEIVYE